MEKENIQMPAGYTDIRFNIFYSVCIMIAAILMVAIFLMAKGKEWYYDFFLILALLFFAYSINALTGGKYIRLDKRAKTIKIYGPYGFVVRKYKYDRLLFKDKELYREIDGKTKFINILRHQCRKNDLEAFIVEVNKEA